MGIPRQQGLNVFDRLRQRQAFEHEAQPRIGFVVICLGRLQQRVQYGAGMRARGRVREQPSFSFMGIFR